MAKVTKQQIIKALKQCIDPELRVDIWSLGLIYDIKIRNKNPEGEPRRRAFGTLRGRQSLYGAGKKTIIDITATLTTPACALGPYIIQDITTRVEKIPGVSQCNVIITFYPSWGPDKMTDDAKAKLGFLIP